MRFVRLLLFLALFAALASVAHAQTCSTPAAQLISPADGSTLQPDPATGLITFSWCNASADYFVTMETIPGAHDLYFAFVGGAGAGFTSLSLGPACNAAPPLGCVPRNGEHISFFLQTVKNKQTIGVNQYSFTAPGATAPKPDFSVTSSKPSISMAAGGTATTVLTIAGQAGYNGIVNFTCSGLPVNSTCGFNPATVAGGGTTTMTIATTPSAALRHAPGFGWPTAFAGLSFAGLLLGGFPGGKRNRLWTNAMLVVVAGSLITLGGCGGSTANVAAPRVTTGTPAGTSTITVTASDGTITHSTTLTLTVQ